MRVSEGRVRRVVFLSLALLFVSAIITAHSARNTQIGVKLGEIVLNVTAPINRVYAGFHQMIAGYIKHLVDLNDAAEVNTRLNLEVTRLRGEVVRLDEFRKENERLRGLLAMVNGEADKNSLNDVTEKLGKIDEGAQPENGKQILKEQTLAEKEPGAGDLGVTEIVKDISSDTVKIGDEISDTLIGNGPIARVIGINLAGWSNVVTIDVGSKQGVGIGHPVVAAAGLVGRVITVSSDAALVLPITDPKSSVDSLLQESRARGVFEGVGRGEGELRYLSSGISVELGDRVITSGFDGVFPSGILVGEISSIGESTNELFREFGVKPSVDISAVEQVMVLTSGIPQITHGPKELLP